MSSLKKERRKKGERKGRKGRKEKENEDLENVIVITRWTKVDATRVIVHASKIFARDA